jgi:hypothetical protein
LLEVEERTCYRVLEKESVVCKRKEEQGNPRQAPDLVQLLRENWLTGDDNPNFSLKGLRHFLKKNNSYPDKYRGVIWSYLLALPKNYLAFDNYVKKGAHKEFQDLAAIFPLKNADLMKKLSRVLSSLAHYSPIFTDKLYVPYLIFPFVKLFSNEECIAFEVILSFLLHWGQLFFENYPQPSNTLVSYVRHN